MEILYDKNSSPYYSLEHTLGKWINSPHWKGKWWIIEEQLWKYDGIWTGYEVDARSISMLRRYVKSKSEGFPLERMSEMKAIVYTENECRVGLDGFVQSIMEIRRVQGKIWIYRHGWKCIPRCYVKRRNSSKLRKKRQYVEYVMALIMNH